MRLCGTLVLIFEVAASSTIVSGQTNGLAQPLLLVASATRSTSLLLHI
jgi:hypothetical protein